MNEKTDEQGLWCYTCAEGTLHTLGKAPKCKTCETVREAPTKSQDGPMQHQRERMKAKSYGNRDLRTGALRIDAQIFG